MMNIFLKKWYFPITIKYLSLIVYIVLIITGLLAYSSDTDFLKELRNTNFGNLIVWSYWWPGIVVAAIFFGRIWCMICPVEVITTFFSKIGLKHKRPKWLLSGWAITLFYIAILLFGIQGLAIHRNPFFMSIYLLSIVGVSIVIGSIYEKNTFCRYVCPVGYLLGLYSRLSIFGWRVKNKSICESCKDKSCIHKKYQYNLNEKSCGVDLYPANINDNGNCILCTGCLKTCHKYQSEPNINRPNPGFRYIGFAKDLFQLTPLKIAEMVFVLVVSGFVISEIWSEWKVTDTYLNYIPNILIEQLHINNKFITGLIKGAVIFGVVPAIIWFLPWLFLKLTKSNIRIKDYLLNYGIAFIPIIAASHLNKSILKSTSRLPYFKYLFDDMTGLSTAQKIIDSEIAISSNPLWLNIGISFAMVIITSIGIYLSYKVIRLQNNARNFDRTPLFTYLIPIVYGGIFLAMILIWRWNM